MVFVDDGASDATLTALARRGAATRRCATSHSPAISAIRPLCAPACVTRVGRAVIVMDADFEHPPELIPELVAEWRKGVKIVTTRRIDDEAQVSTLKRSTSQLYYRLLDAIGDVRIEPGSADYMLLDRAVVDVVNLLRGPGRIPARARALARLSRSSRAVPRAARASTAKAAIRCAAWSSSRSPASRRTACGRCASRSGSRLASRCSASLLVIYSIVSFLFVQHTVAGWSSIMAVIAILGAAQLLVLGIIGEYVGRILRETRRRPSYIVAETEAQHSEREVGSKLR